MKLNTQAPEKRSMKETLEVHSIFSTIQGEGPFCGHPAVFLRLAGCNLQCPGCDTEYTNGRQVMTAQEIVMAVTWCAMKDDSAAKLVVITGGEPFRQNVGIIIDDILAAGFHIQFETNGTMPVPRVLERWSAEQYAAVGFEKGDAHGERNERVTVVCSPKASKIHPSVMRRANCFKYVMKAGNTLEEDGLPLQALDHQATPYLARPDSNYSGTIYLQPMDEQDEEKNKANIAAVLKSCKTFNYVLQLQVHKYIGVE